VNPGKKTIFKILKTLQIFFYLAFLFLWFKDNFIILRKIKISFLIPLVLLAIVLVARFVLKIKSTKIKLKPELKRDLIALILIIFLVSAVHVPYLVHNYGLMESDEAIPALMGKHIAEGKIPALYYYGALFQGSLPQHFYALLFKLFGFSAFMAKLAAYLAFAAFLCAHFFLLKEIFSLTFAWLVCFFYVLPFQHLIISSFDLGSGFPVVFLFGSLIFYLTYLISYENKDRWIAPLGFFAGLAFWTHQISFIFILIASLFLVFHFKFQWKKYIKIIFYFLIGIFPILMSEIAWRFPLVKLLLSGEAGSLSPEKVTRAKNFLVSLISSGPEFLNYASLFLIFVGIAILVILSIQKKKILPSGIFVVYFIAFIAVYLFSGFSNVNVIRYHYILYLVLPVFLGALFLFIKNHRIRYFSIGLFFLLLFFLNDGKSSLSYYQSTKARHLELRQLLSEMEDTGEKYWKGDYWIAYLMNALSKENLMVASSTVERYPYYRLLYESETSTESFIFQKGNLLEERLVSNLEYLLNEFKVEHKKKQVHQWLLVYDIKSPVYTKNLFFPPEQVPEVVLERINPAPAGLEAHFLKKNQAAVGGFRLHVGVPGYCQKFMPIPEKERFMIRIPSPPEKRFKLKYYTDHNGFVLGSTIQVAECRFPEVYVPSQREAVEYLSGIGPRKKILGKERLVCDKEARLQVNKPLHPDSQMTLSLSSPLFFDDPFWYGNYFQEVDIFVNGQFFLKKRLDYGENVIRIDCSSPPFKPKENILSLRFKYALVLSNQDHWKTAAYLERIAVN